MPGRPVHRGRAPRPGRNRQDWYRARDKISSDATALNRIQPGAGDEYLAEATRVLDQLRQRALSSFPGLESQAS